MASVVVVWIVAVCFDYFFENKRSSVFRKNVCRDMRKKCVVILEKNACSDMRKNKLEC